MAKIGTAACALACCMAAAAAAAAPVVERDAASVTATLGNGVRLEFALGPGGVLLGLRSASLDGLALKSGATVVRPFILEEHTPDPRAWTELRLKDVRAEGDDVRVICDLPASDGRAAARRLFVFDGDRPRVDDYLFPHLRLPSEVCRMDAAPAAGPGTAPAAGTLAWVFEPIALNVAGWPWRGWKHHYEVTLAGGRKLNCLRELGTWEVGGQAQGVTLVNLRYRGLGGIVCRVGPDTSFTTTEFLPGAAGKPAVVSPAVPGPQSVSGREEAMRIRYAAWIAQDQRGAGVNAVDFQYRPGVALAAWYERAEAVRSLTEVWPGDREVSQTDCLYFPLTDEFRTVPKVHLALKADLPEHEWHTRWQEMDAFVRDLLARELGFVPSEPLPSLGINWDTAWESRIAGLAGRVEALKAAGVRRLLVHHPGWFNGRGLRQGESSFPIPRSADGKPDTGGDCSIHDYVPQSDRVRDLWKDLAGRLDAAGIEYWAWVTGMVYGTGPVVQRFGEARFCRNATDVDFSSGYPGRDGRAGHRGIAILDPEIRAWWSGRMDTAVRELGIDGFWADSFHNMFMSQMNYQRPDWAPQARAWWEWIAAASRNGAGFMAESTAFPGLSCSIEVGGNPADFEGVWWVLPYTTRWYRGERVPHAGTAGADRLFFRSMANKGPICPGGDDVSQVPGYARLSAEYMSALPRMKRPYQLPGEAGVLWLGGGSDREGVLFSFVDAPAPAGVDGAPSFAAHRTHPVRADDLLSVFGLRRGPLPDPRKPR